MFWCQTNGHKLWWSIDACCRGKAMHGKPAMKKSMRTSCNTVQWDLQQQRLGASSVIISTRLHKCSGGVQGNDIARHGHQLERGQVPYMCLSNKLPQGHDWSICAGASSDHTRGQVQSVLWPLPRLIWPGPRTISSVILQSRTSPFARLRTESRP